VIYIGQGKVISSLIDFAQFVFRKWVTKIKRSAIGVAVARGTAIATGVEEKLTTFSGELRDAREILKIMMFFCQKLKQHWYEKANQNAGKISDFGSGIKIWKYPGVQIFESQFWHPNPRIDF
jgi:hypothetical protein